MGCERSTAPVITSPTPPTTAGPTSAAPTAASTASDPSVAQWVKQLGSQESQARVAAADALAAMGPQAVAAVPELIVGLADGNFWAALAVADALSAIGEPAAPALAECMEHGQGLAPLRAALALRGMGAAARPALPALRKALQGDNPRIRDLAADAIAQIERGADRPATDAVRRGASSAAVRPTVPPGTSDDWSGFRGPRRDGLCLETDLRASWPSDGPKLVWKTTGLGKGYSSVSIAGGRLFTMGDRMGNRKEGQFVLACDAATGKEQWASWVGPPHVDGPRSTPTVDGPLLYALGTDGDLLCLETATGKERWRKSFARDFGGQMMSIWKFSESPLVDGDRLICTPGGKDAALVALDKHKGTVVWRCKLPELGPKGKDGAGYSSAVVAEIDGVRQYIQLLGRGVVGVAAADGKLLWSYNRIANEVANVATPIVRGNHVFVTTSYKTGSALLKISSKAGAFSAEEVYFLDATQFENHHGGVLLVGDYLYGGHGLNRGQPVCIHFPTGEIVWKPKTLGRGSAAVTYADGHVVFRYDRGETFWVAANPLEFRVQGNFRPAAADGPAWAYPVVHGKRLYLRHADVLACYDLSGRG